MHFYKITFFNFADFQREFWLCLFLVKQLFECVIDCFQWHYYEKKTAREIYNFLK